MASKSTRDFVTEQVRSINEVLARSLCSADRRQGQIDACEMMLRNAKMFYGFSYLTVDEVPHGELPGIIVHGTVEDTPVEVRFAPGTVDTTRVRFVI